jgi:hypothetical protein
MRPTRETSASAPQAASMDAGLYGRTRWNGPELYFGFGEWPEGNLYPQFGTARHCVRHERLKTHVASVIRRTSKSVRPYDFKASPAPPVLELELEIADALDSAHVKAGSSGRCPNLSAMPTASALAFWSWRPMQAAVADHRFWPSQSGPPLPQLRCSSANDLQLETTSSVVASGPKSQFGAGWSLLLPWSPNRIIKQHF